MLGMTVTEDPDAGGPMLPTVTTNDELFGISNNLISAMGNFPASLSETAPGAEAGSGS